MAYRISLAVVLLLMVGCASLPPITFDDYQWITPERNTQTMTINWIRTNSPVDSPYHTTKKANEICREMGSEAPINRIINACATWITGKKVDSGICTIYSPRILRENDYRSLHLGHETAHCFMGQYHEVVR